MNGVRAAYRHSRNKRCPICGGAKEDKRGDGKRCWGIGTEGKLVICVRDEFAGNAERRDCGYLHYLDARCKCGVPHGPDDSWPELHSGNFTISEAEDETAHTPANDVVAAYVYEDEQRRPLFRVLRTADKQFPQQHPLESGGWAYGLNGATRTLYKLPELLASTGTVYIVEGEKDVETLLALGLSATTSPGGAGKWHFVEGIAKTALKGRDVVVVADADADDKGRRHARDILRSLRGFVKSIVAVESPLGKDVTEHLEKGGSLEGLVSMKRPAFPFKIWTADEIFAPLEPPDYAVDKLLVRGSLALLVAKGSSSKTWIAVDLAIASAMGDKWLGFQCAKGRALIVDWESGSYELRRRYHMITQGHLATRVEGADFVTMSKELLFTTKNFEKHIMDLADEYELIVFDSLAAGSVGLDENDVRFAASLNTLKGICEKTKCTMLVLHHARKGQGEDTDPRDAVRGSGAIFAAADVILQLGSSKGTTRLFQTKARGGKAIDPLTVELEDITSNAIVVRANEVDDLPKAGSVSSKLDSAKRELIELLGVERGLTSKNELCRRVKSRKTTTLDALAELTERKVVVISDGVYRLASDV